ncbi:MAG: hypothetical protein R3A51_01275 [Nannocystaceae bacterium]
MGLSTGCIFGLGGGDPTDPTQFEGCAPAGADIDAHVQISLDFQQSMHELVVCGGLTIKVSVAASEALYQLIFASAVNALPPEFSYQGDGLYPDRRREHRHGPAGFVLGRLRGRRARRAHHREPVRARLLPRQRPGDRRRHGRHHHLRRAGAARQAARGSGDPNPLVLTSADALTISTELNKIKVRGTVRVDDDREGTDVAYDVDLSAEPDRQPALAVWPARLRRGRRERVPGRAQPAARRQQLGRALHRRPRPRGDGRVRGRRRQFDYVGALEYASGGYGDLRLECP